MDVASPVGRHPRALLVTPPQSPPLMPAMAPMAPMAPLPANDHFRPGSVPEDDRGRMVKQIKGCLNKITPEKYAPLATQIVGYFEPATSDAIVPLIFEKALNELHFAEMYADLFCDLLRKVATCVQSHTTFLMALMLRCNLELTKALHTEEGEADQAAEKAESDHKMAKRSVGIAHFIGELFLRNLLKEDFLFKVASKLLHLTDPAVEVVKETEAEVACKLIETAGAKWENESPRFTEDLLPRVDAIREHHPSARIRFLFLDLSDLRARGWQHRFQKEKPHRLTEDGGGFQRPSSLPIPDGLSSAQIAEGRTVNDPYNSFGGAVPQGPRASTPPPTRGIPLMDLHHPAQALPPRRGMTPPPRRMPPYLPVAPYPPAAAPPPQPSSLSPTRYQHDPYCVSSPPVSPSPYDTQPSWAEMAHPSWRSSTSSDSEPMVPSWQQSTAPMTIPRDPQPHQGWQQQAPSWPSGPWEQPRPPGSMSPMAMSPPSGGGSLLDMERPLPIPPALLARHSTPTSDRVMTPKGKQRRALNPYPGGPRYGPDSPPRLRIPVDTTRMDPQPSVALKPPGDMQKFSP
jgi:hypothetical protein